MWSKLLEAVYDTLVFIVFMGAVLLLFTFGLTYLMGRVKAAPAPLPKKVRIDRNYNNEANFYGSWDCLTWPTWKLSFQPGGSYSAISSTSIWEGTWKLDTKDGQLAITVEEHPIDSPQFTITYTIYATSLSRAKIVVTD
jgi:hypothetical protein